jgi:uncharacterized repeat protein (TIGR01451 family)/fimbrial isopeptide formation D2 family protein
MNNASQFRFKSILIFTLLFLIKSFSFAQSQFMQEANSNGFFLKKVVSDTTIQSGQSFTYTIYFSFPANANSVTITDVLPAQLVFQGYAVSAVCGTMNVLSAPTVGNAGGTLQLGFPSTPAGCSGSISMTVNFPNGTTCNGEGVRNRVCLVGKVGTANVDLCTGFVSTSAKATDPWHLNKYVLNAAYQGGNCPNVTLDSVITYRIYAWKDVGTTGQLNLANAFVYDTLPAGAVLTGTPSCGANMLQSGNVITWNVGNLSALPAYNQAYCDFQVYYPRAIFPVGSLITNKGTMKGILGSPNKSCGNGFYPSNTTCVEIRPFAQGTLSKTVYTNGQPGCAGYYWIQICNNGTLALSNLTVKDTLPLGISAPSVSAASGVTASIAGGIVTATYLGSLAPNQCIWVKVDFTIPLSATIGSTITNCATLTSPSLTNAIQSCTSFIVNTPLATPCLWKEVCSKQASYLPGQTFRYRLRVQNIGGTALTGASLTDVLDANLQYVGNPTYYSATSYNIACSSPALPSGATAWTGVGFSQSGQTLTWNLPSIPAVCQTIFYGNCGQYGTWGVPFYFIEFDVMVKNTACLGNIPNFFSISGGNVTAQNSNIDYVDVAGTAAFNADKTVSNDNGTTYSAATTTAAGNNVRFKLKFSPAAGSTAAMRHVTVVDLMPRDNGTGDFYILNRSISRGSQYDLQFQAGVSSVPASTSSYDALNVLDAKVNGIIVAGVGVMFPYSGGTGIPSWTVGAPPVNSKNLSAYFGAAPIAAPNTAEGTFDAKVPAGTTAQFSSCNTFAANAAVCHLINSSLMTNIPMSPLESVTACVTATPSVFSCCDSVILYPSSAGTNCCSRIASAKCDIKNVNVTVTNGIISNAVFAGTSATCFNNPSPAIGQTNYTFTPANNACSGMDLQICATPTNGNNTVIVNYTLVFFNGDTCRRADTLKCISGCCQEVQVIKQDTAGYCCSQLKAFCPIKNIQVSVTNGSLGDVSFAGANAACFTQLIASPLTTANFPANCAANNGVNLIICPIIKTGPMIITYVITFADGTTCTKADTLKCTPKPCCETIQVINFSTQGKCCSQIKSFCPIKNVQVDVVGGTIGDVSFGGSYASCYTPLVGSSLTTANFPANCTNMGVDLMICPKTTSSPTIVHYVIAFADGSKCEKYDTLNCAPPCCDGVKIQPVTNPTGTTCCSRITSTCPIGSVTATLVGGTISSNAFASPCSALSTVAANGLTSYTFIGACTNLDLTLCATPTTASGIVIINYQVNFTNGVKCVKSDTLKCEPNCCDGVKIVPAPNLKCCSQLTTTCPVRQILVSVVSGGLLGNVTFGGTSAASYTGVTGSTATLMNFTTTGAAATTGMDITVCPKITANPTIIRYMITFMNGAQCEKLDTIRCIPPTSDCIISACLGYTAMGLSVNFNASGTTSNQPIVMYVWNFGDGQYTTTTTPLASHTYTANGTYKVCVTVHTLYNGSICSCVKEICKDVKVAQGTTSTQSCTSGLTSGSTQTEVGRIVASPNPSSADFHITLENATDILSETGSELKLMNLQGQIVFTKKLTIGEKELDIQAVTLPAGLYLVSLLKDGEVISTVKVVKN